MITIIFWAMLRTYKGEYVCWGHWWHYEAIFVIFNWVYWVEITVFIWFYAKCISRQQLGTIFVRGMLLIVHIPLLAETKISMSWGTITRYGLRTMWGINVALRGAHSAVFTVRKREVKITTSWHQKEKMNMQRTRLFVIQNRIQIFTAYVPFQN